MYIRCHLSTVICNAHGGFTVHSKVKHGS